MEALLKLIEEYKGISLELLKSLWKENIYGDEVMNLLTGFGNVETCSICKDAAQKAHKSLFYACEYCIYRKLFPNAQDSLYCLNESYSRMSEAESAEELYEAIQERIKVLEQAIEDYENI